MKFKTKSIWAICASITALFALSPLTSRPAAADSSGLSSAIIYCSYPSIGSPDGTLNGITSQLPRLKETGVNILWLMPITPIGQSIPGHGAFGSPYCVADYYAVNPDYGTPSDFKHLVTTAHKLGIKVVLDEVLNHTSWANPLINQHPEFYVHSDGNVNNPNSIMQAFNYSDVAQLNYANPVLWRYMDAMLAWWVKKYNVDGFRFDSADNPGGPNRKIPASFWMHEADKLHQIKPNIILIGESETPDLALKPFDIDYGWGVYYSLKRVQSGTSAQDVITNWTKQEDNFPAGMLHMSIQDDWDLVCDVDQFGGADGAKAVATFDFTSAGVPLIYNGMEIGNNYSEGTNPHTKIDCNHPNPAFDGFYKGLIALRKNHPALQQGATNWLTNSTPDKTLTYTRSGDGEKFLAIINLSNTAVTGTISGIDRGSNYSRVWPATTTGTISGVKAGSYTLAPHQYDVYKLLRD